MTDGRRLDGYTISSPCEPNGSGELIIASCILGGKHWDSKITMFIHLMALKIYGKINEPQNIGHLRSNIGSY